VPPARPSRKQARRDALFVLYQGEVTGEPIEVLLRKLGDREGYEPDPFTVEAATSVSASAATLDETLRKHSRDWSLGRIAPIERSALRLGLFELQQGVTPAEVVVDEAVRLVRRYASDEGGSLVNGILGAVLREMQSDAEAPAAGGVAEMPAEEDEHDAEEH
jgi:transcription antitermination protein NusB